GSNGASDQDGALAAADLVDRLPAGSRGVLHGQARACLGRSAVAWEVEGDAAEPGRELRQLENPARLVHRIGMDERHDRPAAPHLLIIKWAVDMFRHRCVSFNATVPSLHMTEGAVARQCMLGWLRHWNLFVRLVP